MIDYLGTGALGGRLDHVLSNLNTLYSHQEHQLLLCGDGNLVRLLKAGQTLLEPDRRLEGPSCGLVALGAPATASSSGLKWNLGAHATHPLFAIE
jgi:thiamine pyrophosphokinase